MIGPKWVKIKMLSCEHCDCVISKSLKGTKLFNAREVYYCKHPDPKVFGAAVSCILGYPKTPKWCPAKVGE